MDQGKFVGKVEYDFTYSPNENRQYISKWDEVREAVEKAPVVPKNSNNGWVKIEISDKKNAGRAATAANTHAKRLQKGGKPTWRIRTVTDIIDGQPVLLLRKVPM